MRAWDNESCRGTAGALILPGQQALLLETWLEGNQRRLRLVREQRIVLFSCPDHVVGRNWKLTCRG